MKPWVIFFILIVLCPGFSQAQINLVPNSSFEGYNSCPDRSPFNVGNNSFSFPTILDWWTPSGMDYFNACYSDSGNIFSVPGNHWGFQEGHTGDAYMGLTLFEGTLKNNALNYRDYAETQLTASLKPGLTYRVAFYVSPYDILPGTSSQGYLLAQNVEAFISSFEVPFSGPHIFLQNITPQISNPPSNLISDTAGWTKIEGSFVAGGGEQYITIGNFDDDQSTRFYNRFYSSLDSDFVDYHSSYYLDDVSVTPISTSTRRDSVLCSTNLAGLSISPSISGADSILWDDGNTTAANKVKVDPGIFWVKSFFYGGTVTVTDSFVLGSDLNLHTLLPKDTFICPGGTVQLSGNTVADSYLWSTGSNAQSITISSGGSYYWLKTMNSGCAIYDTINVRQLATPSLPKLRDTSYCKGNSVVVGYGSNPNFYQLQWSTGSSGLSISVNQPGKYLVHLIDTFCSSWDSLTVTENLAPSFSLSIDPPGATVCRDQNHGALIKGPPGMSKYFWNSQLVNGDSIMVYDGGTYRLQVFNSKNCTSSDSIQVPELCVGDVYVPTAFTPNGDGYNELFGPIGPLISNFEMHVWDRWGNEIFVSKDPKVLWDGKYKGDPLAAGLYSYDIQYTSPYHPTGVTKRGVLTLVR